jgi:hypothetical protein
MARYSPELLTEVSAGLTVPIPVSLAQGQLGWLLIGIAALRASVLPKWVSWLMITSVLLLFVLAPFANSQLARLAYNTLLGLGLSSWAMHFGGARLEISRRLVTRLANKPLELTSSWKRIAAPSRHRTPRAGAG